MLKPTLENQRLIELDQLQILDSPYEDEFNNIVELASKICDTPISLISLLDENRQWFKARKGFAVSEADRSTSFCAHAIYQTELLVVNDATKDARFADNPQVTGEPFIRFYAGSQIFSSNGHTLGTLCVLGKEAKELSWQQASTLKLLANQASKLIQLRYRNIEATKLEEKLGEQKDEIENLKRRAKNNSEATRVNNELVHHFLTLQSEPLKTGKFTKKVITSISDEIEKQAARLKIFAETQDFLSRQDALEAGNITEVFLSQAIENVLRNFSALIKKSSLKIFCSVAANASISQNAEAVSLILKIVFQTILTKLTSKRIDIVVAQHGDSSDIRISFNDAALRTELVALLVGDSANSTQMNLLAFEINLLKQVVESVMGNFQIIQVGEDGVALSVGLESK